MKLVNTLTELGLIERRAGRDLRSNALHLTTQGKVMLQAMVDRLQQAESTLSMPLDQAEREALMHLLIKMRSGLGPHTKRI